MEKVRKHRDIKLETTLKIRSYLVSKFDMVLDTLLPSKP